MGATDSTVGYARHFRGLPQWSSDEASGSIHREDECREAIDSPLTLPYRPPGESEHTPADSPARAPKESERETYNAEHLRVLVNKLRLEEQARDIVRRERAEKLMSLPPARESYTLSSYRADPEPEVIERIAGLQRAGHRALLSAQWKNGKSTLAAELAASLADGVPFLGAIRVVKPAGRVGIWNAEMEPKDQRDYLDATQLENPDRVAIWNLRGYRVDLLSDAGRDAAVNWLEDNGVAYWILDPWSEVCAWCGVDLEKNPEVAVLLQRVNEIANAAGVEELLIIHHDGWEAGRPKGATKLPESVDVVWQYNRDDDGIRMLRARGRGVDLSGIVEMDDDTGRLHFVTSTRKEFVFEQSITEAVKYVREHPGCGRTAVYAALSIAASKHAAVVDTALSRGLLIDKTPDARTSVLEAGEEVAI